MQTVKITQKFLWNRPQYKDKEFDFGKHRWIQNIKFLEKIENPEFGDKLRQKYTLSTQSLLSSMVVLMLYFGAWKLILVEENMDRYQYKNILEKI